MATRKALSVIGTLVGVGGALLLLVAPSSGLPIQTVSGALLLVAGIAMLTLSTFRRSP